MRVWYAGRCYCEVHCLRHVMGRSRVPRSSRVSIITAPIALVMNYGRRSNTTAGYFYNGRLLANFIVIAVFVMETVSRKDLKGKIAGLVVGEVKAVSVFTVYGVCYRNGLA